MTPIASSVQAIVDEIDAKLAELRPVVEEYNTLEAARAVLIERGASSRPAPRGRPRAAQPASPPRTAARRAPRGANRAAILAFVASNPGATVVQISDATGIAKPTMHSTVYALRRKGKLAADGDGVTIPSTSAPTTVPSRRFASTTRRAAASRAARRGGRRAAGARRGSRTRAASARPTPAADLSEPSSTVEPSAPHAG
jgi:hypothetical protein